MWPVLLSKTQITGDFSCAAGCLVLVQVELEADAVATLLVWTRSPALTSANNRREGEREKTTSITSKIETNWKQQLWHSPHGETHNSHQDDVWLGCSPDFRAWDGTIQSGERGKMVFKQDKGNLEGWGLRAGFQQALRFATLAAQREVARVTSQNCNCRTRHRGVAKANTMNVCGHYRVSHWCWSFTLLVLLITNLPVSCVNGHRQGTWQARSPGRNSWCVNVQFMHLLPQKVFQVYCCTLYCSTQVGSATLWTAEAD